MDGTWVTWTSALMSMVSTCGAVAALIITVTEGRASRRNTDFLGHRDLWWQRWTWVADRVTSDADHRQHAASLMVHALITRDWVTEDDRWVLLELEQRERLHGRAVRKDRSDDL